MREELTLQKRVSYFNTRRKERILSIFEVGLGKIVFFENTTKDKNDATGSLLPVDFLLNANNFQLIV